ncbi:MAG TPA: OmpA family protein [Candidatus Aminicenantes bacterium]|nr:OmpA family protein [Candidatus Aminicenantes bacterium]HRY65903.1 OmpA family protein [Candidatus Aminicenantes bacterium]HRZ72771.1 OmpA family protein [Candidatus Aminicenantes bacterium]
MKRTIVVVVTFGLLLTSFGCASWSKTAKGATIGAAGGAVVGGVIGKIAGNTLIGAIAGAALGGAAGAYIGRQMDKQAAEMRRDLQGAKVERVGEGIKITFDSGLMFDTNKYDLRAASQENLARLAVILNKYPDTNILVEGHTDSTGTREINMPLSENRAKAVAAYLAVQNVLSSRFTVQGYGPDQPIGDNATVDGRQQNRRVDLAIMANEKLKKVAKESVQGAA